MVMVIQYDKDEYDGDEDDDGDDGEDSDASHADDDGDANDNLVFPDNFPAHLRPHRLLHDRPAIGPCQVVSS